MAERESELLIRGGTLVTMDPARRVFEGDVLTRGSDIVWLGPRGRAPRAGRQPRREVLDARGALVLPGFVQSHVHLCQVLFRGMADDMPLLEWLRRRIWPLEGAHDAGSLTTSCELGVYELLRGGTTTILDMGTTHEQDAVFEVLQRRGLRAISGKAMMDRGGRGVPRKLRETTQESLAESDALRARWHGSAAGRLGYAYAPRFILSCTERLMREVGDRTQHDGALAHTHVAEHVEERQAVQALLGKSDFDALHDYGIGGPRAVMAHGVQLTAREMGKAARLGTRLVHCPSANLKLASGIASVLRLRQRGVVVGIGADGAPCNNRLDALSELRLALLLSKYAEKNARALSPMDALAMLTIDGARCLGLDEQVGSLEPRKRADITVLDVAGVHQAPGLDPLSALAYASSGNDVRHVVVDGVVRVRGGEVLGVDGARLAAEATREARKVAARARLT